MTLRALGSTCAVAALCAVAGCRTIGPDTAATSYARALREGRLDDAYAMTSQAHRAVVSRQEFGRRYPDATSRRARAAAIEAGQVWKSAEGGLDVVREHGAWRVSDSLRSDAPREALLSFVLAAERGDFTEAYQLLSPELRARYTPDRLAADFGAEPLARERLARARAVLGREPVWHGGEVLFPMGDGKAVRLVPEGGVLRVAAIE